MKTLLIAAAIATLIVGTSATAFAEDHHDGGAHRGWSQDQGQGHHWRQGERMGYNDWNSARPVDWRANHLHQPRPGYAWRESNGQYVLAAIATGAILELSEHH
jgi:Ni/Co efflux regulator RcnB